MLFATKGNKEETAQQENYIFDVGVADFENKVLRQSMNIPVIVDFWAPWCGPCKQLGPMLEKAVARAGGAVLMAKVNMDENPELAQALRIQSIPTVYAFYQGQPVDGFAGARQESKINEFITNLLNMADNAQADALDITEALKEAAQALAGNDILTAKSLYSQILGEDKENAQAYAGLIRTYLAEGDKKKASSMISQAPENISKDPAFEEAKTAYELSDIEVAGSSEKIADRLQKYPDDLETRFDLAMALYSEGKKADAAEELLEIIRRDKDWEEEKARKQLLKFFEAWGHTDPATVKARRKLSGVLFS
jgi:putative thioredoxin